MQAEPERASPPAEDRELAKEFCDNCGTLGDIWIVSGLLLGAGGACNLVGTLDRGVMLWGSIATSLGATLCAMGGFVMTKRIWAVYLGLLFSYAVIFGLILRFPNPGVFFLLLLVLVTIQAHRVVRSAERLRARGILLNARMR